MDQEVLKGDSHKDDQPQTDAQCERFEAFAALPVGLRKYVAKDLIGTTLEDIDPFYKDKQVHNQTNKIIEGEPKSLWTEMVTHKCIQLRIPEHGQKTDFSFGSGVCWTVQQWWWIGISSAIHRSNSNLNRNLTIFKKNKDSATNMKYSRK